jgi:competence protein ComEC
MLKRAPHEPALPTPGPLIGAMQATTRGIGGVLLISLVAGLATDPFAIYHFQRFAVYSLPATLIAAPIMSFMVAPAAGAAAVLAPFGWAEPALQVMARALDLIAAVGQTFGERPEAVRALPRPPDDAFVLCIVALLWACLWRGALRWLAIPIFAASVALYANAPLPLVAFDGEARAVYARADNGGWTLMRAGGRSTYARDRLGATLGISPPAIERMASPETCGEAICAWRTGGAAFFLVREEAGFAAACESGAIVLSRVAAPADFAARCELAALMDSADLARSGGGFIYADDGAVRIDRAILPDVRRPWTPQGIVQE